MALLVFVLRAFKIIAALKFLFGLLWQVSPKSKQNAVPIKDFFPKVARRFAFLILPQYLFTRLDIPLKAVQRLRLNTLSPPASDTLRRAIAGEPPKHN